MARIYKNAGPKYNKAVKPKETKKVEEGKSDKGQNETDLSKQSEENADGKESGE